VSARGAETSTPPARHVPPDPREAIRRLLTRRGYRLTRPRQAVLDVLATGREPRTVAQIHRGLGAERANLVSVYRTVKLLGEIGLVRATDATDGQRRYELAEPFTSHHHHLICRRCGHIEDLEGCLLEARVLGRLGRQVRQTHRFRVTDHELRFFGVCVRCDAAGPPRPRQNARVTPTYGPLSSNLASSPPSSPRPSK
jgi:Fur family ferric uptake transcriptional regulator